jgi:alpha-L-arabinofuranosidase
MKLTFLLTIAAIQSAAPLPGWCAETAGPAPVAITVRVDQPGAAPTEFGVFFEDINYGADGGLYPEKVKNRSFEFTDPLMGWTEVSRSGATGARTIRDDRPWHANSPHYLRLTTENAAGGYGAANEGFFGMGVRRGEELRFSVRARSSGAAPPVLLVELRDPAGKPLAEAPLKGFTPEWGEYRCALRPSATEPKARLQIVLAGPGALDLDEVSLFPRDTWKRRPNGLRADLVQLLADMKPAFMRFPGGCIVEGRHLSTRYQWKTTIGKLEERRLIINRWNDEFKHRPAPDYFQSFGLGFGEFFQLCDDIEAKPLPILNCGMACQFNSGELAPMDQLDPYVQDALDLVEFANGPAASPWGARRAEMGHPAPFNLTRLGVGNEQWGPQYIERYAVFARALKARYPALELISGAGPSPGDDRFHFAWPKLRELKADIVDEHCYDRPDWFFKNAGRYDNYERTGPKVFMGEYAAQSVKVVSPENRNDWECALAEAAFMTGLERNGEVVVMASYAPLFAHVEGWQWTPNLIWFDNLRSFGTPSYYVQQLFGRHRGTQLLPVNLSAPEGSRVYASAARDSQTRDVILKIVNAAPAPQRVLFRLAGARGVERTARLLVLASDDLKAENSLDHPTRVAPQPASAPAGGPEFACTLAGQSLTVLRVACEAR